MSRIVLHLAHDGGVRVPMPWPIGIDTETWRATSGLGQDDGATLIGFGPAGEQRITLFREDAVAEPERAVGLTASFSDGEGFFLWNIPVASIETKEPGDA